MNSIREHIFHQIKNSLGRENLTSESLDSLRMHLAKPQIYEQPALKVDELIPKFVQQVTKVAGTVQILSTVAEIPFAVLDFLQQQHFPPKIIVDKALQTLTWPHKLQLVQYEPLIEKTENVVSVNLAFAGIAETGSVVLLSGATNPTSLNFLPAIHLVILYQTDLVAYFEEVWHRLRQQSMPRSVNIITGPSRTADIEQTIQLGAHGPKQLRILMVNGEF
jgi:L-lactate dehydrogenase complex protein LldG